MSQAPTIGRVVHYKLSEQDAEAIARRRGQELSDTLGHEFHRNDGVRENVGNNAYAGNVFPMLITRVLDGAYVEGGYVNGQVFLDGNDTHWVTSVHEGPDGRQWTWPERVA